MGISNLNLSPENRDYTTEPKKIFESLTLRGDIQNIWGPQENALEMWYEDRDESDTVIRMATGSGKTLVGLLIGKSLINEKQRNILYVCPTNQLIEQVESHASECGIPTSSYYDGTWKDKEKYESVNSICITNYHSIFHGYSKFYEHDIGGIIFDDAHVAVNTIRDNFTINIDIGEDTSDFDHEAAQFILSKYRPFFQRSNQSQRLKDVLDGHWGPLLFVPMFEVYRSRSELAHYLREAGIESSDQTYAWKHLKDKIGLCTVLINRRGIEISPPCLPTQQLPYFSDEVSRVYLTATVPTPTEFVKTFGVSEPNYIEPGGKQGTSQRQFHFLPGETDQAQREKAQELADEHKAAIIVPSGGFTSRWNSYGDVYKGKGQEQITKFLKSDDADKIIFVARYDGIDLPGKSCPILIIDGIPRGESLIDRFIDEGLRVTSYRLSRTAVRIVQALGRIFRGNTDHGAVFLCGNELQRWFKKPRNRSHLPDLLQKQVQLGIQLRQAIDENSEVSHADLLEAVLQGERNWDKKYRNFIDKAEAESIHSAPEWLENFTRLEQDAYMKLWTNRASDAASIYGRIAQEAESKDQQLSAWYRHFKGLAHDVAGDNKAAAEYIKAANTRTVLGRPDVDEDTIRSDSAPDPTEQSKSIAALINQRGGRVFKGLDIIDDGMKYGRDNTDQAEDSLTRLGIMLGLETSRPDNEEGTGPDVIWVLSSLGKGAAIEAKTGKGKNSTYRKNQDIAQFHDHIEYLSKEYSVYDFEEVIIGRELPVASESNPPENLKIIPLGQFHDLADRTRTLYDRLQDTENGGEPLEIQVQRQLDILGLDWPRCINSLQSTLATDLKSHE